MIRLKYGNTNTFFIRGESCGLLIDTDYAGTLPAFYRALKAAGLGLRDIGYILATHYHPDHMGLVSELMKQGARLLLADVQKGSVHFSDRIFARDHLPAEPIREEEAVLISCAESRDFLAGLGISGEIISTPSHSPDSISLLLDNGDAFVGDLEPLDYLPAYDENAALKRDWEQVLAHHPRRIFYAHANEKVL